MTNLYDFTGKIPKNSKLFLVDQQFKARLIFEELLIRIDFRFCFAICAYLNNLTRITLRLEEQAG